MIFIPFETRIEIFEFLHKIPYSNELIFWVYKK